MHSTTILLRSEELGGQSGVTLALPSGPTLSFRAPWWRHVAVNEPAYKLDRMLTQLLQASAGADGRQAARDGARQLAGLALGQFANVRLDASVARSGGCNEEDEEKAGADWFWLDQTQLPRSLPILADLPVGHIHDNRVLPLGAMVELDLGRGTLCVVGREA